MFDKFFEGVALKQLQENAFDRWMRERNDRFYRKKGWITTYPNGTEGFNVVKAHAHNLKVNALMLGVVYPGAAILGIVLSKMNHKN